MSGGTFLTDATMTNAVSVDASGRMSFANNATKDPSAALIAHAAAAAGTSSADQANTSARGIKVVVDVTAITGTTPTLTVTLQGKDPISGKYYTLLASAALSAVGTTVLTVYPGLTAAANLTANDVLPATWRVITAIGGTTPAVTATIAATLLG